MFVHVGHSGKMALADVSSMPPIAGFWDGGGWYPCISFWIATAGLLVTVLGFGMAWRQLRKTRSAAEAAEAAAQESAAKLAQVVTLAGLSRLCSLCGEAKRMLENRRRDAALVRLSDVRASLNELRGAEPQLFGPKVWQTLVMAAAESEASLRGEEEFDAAACLVSVAKIHDALSEKAGNASRKVGES